MVHRIKLTIELIAFREQIASYVCIVSAGKDQKLRKSEVEKTSSFKFIKIVFIFVVCNQRKREAAAITIPAKWYSATQIWVSDFMYTDFVQNDLI